MNFNKGDITALVILYVFLFTGLIVAIADIKLQMLDITIFVIGVVVYFIIGIKRKRLWFRLFMLEGTLAVFFSVVFIILFCLLLFTGIFFEYIYVD